MQPMRILRVAIVAAFALASPLRAQQTEGGVLTMLTRTSHPLRTAYRAGIDALLRAGYGIAIMSLDRALLTPERLADGRPAPWVVRVMFERRGDSTQVAVAAVVPDSTGRALCNSDLCTRQSLVAVTGVIMGLDSALARVKPSPRTAADSLAAAKALGYAPENPIRVGGRLEDGDRNERKFLEELHGPAGEAVTYLRLGSCCEFPTRKGIDGTGLLDAYEVRYPGLLKPVTLYLDMYTAAPPSQGVPVGFTHGPSPPR
jgi:hypothetical protein